MAEELFAGVPGAVTCDRWRGYGPSRNVALGRARQHSDWVLTLDADDTFHGVIDRAVPAEYDGAEAEYHVNPLRFWIPRLVRSSERWEWRARAHEYLTLPGRPVRLMRTKSFYVEHHADGGNRATKYERELALLQADHRDDPDNPRTTFYLARTYEDGGHPDMAATFYQQRLDLEGWAEETWYAMWRLGCCLLATDRADEGCGVLWKAWGHRPWRAEPLWSLATHYRLTAQWQLGFEACELARRQCGVGGADPGDGLGGDRLFVHTDVYEWRISYEQSICAYYVGERALGKELIAALSARTDLPPVLAANIASNGRFYEG